MNWTSKKFSNYDKWEFEFAHMGYEIYLVVKLRRVVNRMRMSYYVATWRADKMRGSQFELLEYIPDKYWEGDYVPHNVRRRLFKNIRQSLAYGLNVKGRGTVLRLMEANGQHIPHKHTRIRGKA